MLARDTDCMGYSLPGVVGVCAWPAGLWNQDLCKYWHREHAELLDRLGVHVRKTGTRWVAEWTANQALAFQLLHVFLHELGHHRDRSATRNGRIARGEPYAEQFAVELEQYMWDDFVRVFPL